MSPNARAAVVAAVTSGLGAVGTALSLVPLPFLSRNAAALIGTPLAWAFALPGLLLLAAVRPDHVTFNLLASPVVNFALYWLFCRGILSLKVFRERKIWRRKAC